MQVTAEHIEKGRRGDPRCCPVTLCLQDHFDGLIHTSKIFIDTATPFNEYGSERHLRTYVVGPNLAKWIQDYDCGEDVDPMELEVICDQVHIKE